MYIKINLLPQEFRPRKSLVKFDIKLAIIILIVISGLSLGGYYVYLLRSFSNFQDKKQDKTEELDILRLQLKSLVDLQIKLKCIEIVYRQQRKVFCQIRA